MTTFSLTRRSRDHDKKWKLIVFPVLPVEALLLARKIRHKYFHLAHPWIIDTDAIREEDNDEHANMNLWQLDPPTMKSLIE